MDGHQHFTFLVRVLDPIQLRIDPKYYHGLYILIIILFKISGSIGLIWFVLWTLLIYESPLEHPYISEAEILYIGTTQNGEKSRKVNCLRIEIVYRMC